MHAALYFSFVSRFLDIASRLDAIFIVCNVKLVDNARLGHAQLQNRPRLLHNNGWTNRWTQCHPLFVWFHFRAWQMKFFFFFVVTPKHLYCLLIRFVCKGVSRFRCLEFRWNCDKWKCQYCIYGKVRRDVPFFFSFEFCN